LRFILESPLAKKIILFFIVLSSNSFFLFRYIPESTRDMLELVSLFLILLFVVANLLFSSSTTTKKHFSREVHLFLLAVFFSMFVADYYHNQNIGITLLAQRFMYFYFFYFLLHTFKLHARDIEKIMVTMGVLYVVFFVIQYAIHPAILFEARIDVDRGTLRIFLPALGFMFFTYYKFLQEYLTTQKLMYGALVFVFFLVGGVLQGTRQTMATMTLLTLGFIFFNKQVKSRLLNITLAVFAGFAIFILFHDMFLEILAATQQETTTSQPNVRVRAVRFFLSDFMPADIAYILGNGQDSMNSTYGQRIHIYRFARGFFQSDIGIIGDYTKFGILFVIAQLSVMIRLIFGKLPSQTSFMRYLFISIALVMFSGRNLFGTSDGIVFVTMILYLVDFYKNQQSNTPHHSPGFSLKPESS